MHISDQSFNPSFLCVCKIPEPFSFLLKEIEFKVYIKNNTNRSNKISAHHYIRFHETKYSLHVLVNSCE